MTLPALIFSRRDDDDIANRLQDLRDRSDPGRTNPVIVADQDAIRRGRLALLRADWRKQAQREQ
jgi:hypothetical protein